MWEAAFCFEGFKEITVTFWSQAFFQVENVDYDLEIYTKRR